MLADVAPVVDVLVGEEVADDHDLAVGQLVGPGVAETETAVVVIEERQQLRGGIEADERVMRFAAVLERFDLALQILDHVLLVNLAAVAVLRIQDVAILPLAPEHALHELKDRVALANEVARLDGLEREKAASTHAESDSADAPVMDAVDLWFRSHGARSRRYP